MVIHSPLARDSVRVPDPSNPKLRIRKNKLLLQCSIREMHKDLYNPEIGLDDMVLDDEGKPLISDTMMRALLPPELRVLTNTYKECCCCELCTSMSYLQAALNRFRKTFLALLEKILQELKDSTLQLTKQRREQLALAESTLHVFKEQGFDDGGDALHPKGKDAAYSMQCDPPPGFEDSGITKLKCALGDCPDCGEYCQPISEQTEVEKPIKYYSFKNLPTCSSCGALPEKSKSCPLCVAKHPQEKDRGKIRNRKHLSLNDQPFDVFFKLYLKTLKNYRIHRFKFLVLSKKMTVDVRQSSLKQGDVALQHDFSEGLKIVHNEEVSDCFLVVPPDN